MEQLFDQYGRTILNIVGAIAIIIILSFTFGIGQSPETHTFTAAEVGTTVQLSNPIVFAGEEYIPALTYDVDSSDVGHTVELGSGLLGRIIYIVFNNMQEQK